MLRKIGMVGLLCTTTFGISPLPVWADNATVQNATQGATINGDNNQVIQVINQVNINRPGRGGIRWHQKHGNSATVQDASQGANVNGSNNQVDQKIIQENLTRAARGKIHRELDRGRSKRKHKD
jgi:hypothetical protein